MICRESRGSWRFRVLRLSGGQAESLFDLGLPVEVAELPADLAALDARSPSRDARRGHRHRA